MGPPCCDEESGVAGGYLKLECEAHRDGGKYRQDQERTDITTNYKGHRVLSGHAESSPRPGPLQATVQVVHWRFGVATGIGIAYNKQNEDKRVTRRSGGLDWYPDCTHLPLAALSGKSFLPQRSCRFSNLSQGT